MIPGADDDVTDAEHRSGVDTDLFSFVVRTVDVDDDDGGDVASSSFDVSWSSLECPLSLLVSLSLSESSSDFLSDSDALSDSALSDGLTDDDAAVSFCPACIMCCPKEKMETRLVIWSISMVW